VMRGYRGRAGDGSIWLGGLKEKTKDSQELEGGWGCTWATREGGKEREGLCVGRSGRG